MRDCHWVIENIEDLICGAGLSPGTAQHGRGVSRAAANEPPRPVNEGPKKRARGDRPGAFDVLDYATRSSATLGEGLERLVRYHRILHDAAVVQLRVEGNSARLTHAPPADTAGLPRHPAEFIVAAWVVVARQNTGLEVAPGEVSFPSLPAGRSDRAPPPLSCADSIQPAAQRNRFCDAPCSTRRWSRFTPWPWGLSRSAHARDVRAPRRARVGSRRPRAPSLQYPSHAARMRRDGGPPC